MRLLDIRNGQILSCPKFSCAALAAILYDPPASKFICRLGLTDIVSCSFVCPEHLVEGNHPEPKWWLLVKQTVGESLAAACGQDKDGAY